jgi:hypothetical protein
VPSRFRTAAYVPACALVALGIAACGATKKPLAGTPNVLSAPGIHAKVDDARTNHPDHVACIKSSHLPVTLIGPTDMRVGSGPGAPYVHFAATAGAAQEDQISGVAKFQGAEVIGSALLWPNAGSATEVKAIESCLAQGVNG